MNKFEQLIKYIPLIQDDKFGEWIIDKENDGTPEHPFHMPFVNYSQTVDSFQEDLYKFCEEHPGALLDFFNSGCILRWLERLKTIDEGGVFNDD